MRVERPKGQSLAGSLGKEFAFDPLGLKMHLGMFGASLVASI